MEMIKRALKIEAKQTYILLLIIANTYFMFYLSFHIFAMLLITFHLIVEFISQRIIITEQSKLIKIQTKTIKEQDEELLKLVKLLKQLKQIKNYKK